MGKLDLRLPQAPAAMGIEGWWTYQPIDGSASFRIEIRATPTGFYEYEGKKEGSSVVVLEIDRATEGALYRGVVTAGLDPCIPGGARFSIATVSDRLELDPVFPIQSTFVPGPPGPCREAARHFIVAAGRDEEVRLRPPSDLGLVAPTEGATPAPDRASGDRGSPKPPTPPDPSMTTSVSVGGPSVSDGAEVQVLGSQRDVRGRVWHHVRVLAPAPALNPGADEARDQAAPAEEGEKREDRGGTSAKTRKKGAGRSEPPSGFVPAGNVVSRFACTLVRAGADRPAPAPGVGGS